MLPKHLTLNIERRLETTIYKDTMETPWLRNQCATAKQRASVCHNPDPRFMLFVVKHCIKKFSRNKLCYPLHSCNILWLLSCYDEVSSSNVHWEIFGTIPRFRNFFTHGGPYEFNPNVENTNINYTLTLTL